jgi:hypothetical protein
MMLFPCLKLNQLLLIAILTIKRPGGILGFEGLDLNKPIEHQFPLNLGDLLPIKLVKEIKAKRNNRLTKGTFFGSQMFSKPKVLKQEIEDRKKPQRLRSKMEGSNATSKLGPMIV